MAIEVKEITVDELTDTTLDGAGVFDKLMRVNKAHLETELLKSRITGPEYSQVYLSAFQAVLSGSLQFVLQSQKASLESLVLEQQIEKSKAEVTVAQEQINLIRAQVALAEQQVLNAQQDLLNSQQALLNAEQDLKVGIAQECKLKGEFDLIVAQTAKVASETTLLAQKLVTEQAQTQSGSVDENSVVGRQKALYAAQTAGFSRDAEQKVAKILVDTWNVRRTTDEGTVTSDVNKLTDVEVGRAVNKLLNGVGA